VSRKPEDVRVPYLDWYYYGPEKEKEEPKAPPMYDQAYVDNLKMEVEYYKNRYRDLLLINHQLKMGK
jgi:hypothetical protein